MVALSGATLAGGTDVSGAVAGESRAATPTQAVRLDEAGVISPRWAGYVVAHSHVSYTSATGTWVEPHATCAHRRPTSSLSAIWVGLGGYRAGSNLLAQIGIDANCNSASKPVYYAWFELLPDVAHPLSGTVEAGDTIIATVSMVKANLVQLRVSNRTRRWTETRAITWSLPDTTTAEWIVEAPYSCARFNCRPAPLTDFGSVSIYNVSAVGNGARGDLASASWSSTPLRLVPCAAPTAPSPALGMPAGPAPAGGGAKPSRFTHDGSRFQVSWTSPVGPLGACGQSGQAEPGGSPDFTIR